MKIPERQFETVHAEPGPRPLWVGLMGPSGGGKTFSALRLAKGIQSVTGGKIELVDTESGRGKHYAEMFDYQYTAFPPPHSSLDYLAVINHAIEVNGSKIVIVDSFSHEHEGEGGLIEYQEAEVERLSKGDYSKVEAVKMLAWTRPKTARKQLLRAMIAHGTDVVFILCFRADDQSKPVKEDGKTKVIQMGFMPIAGKPFVYEATVCALLLPAANGVPEWEPQNVGERLMRKLPEQFKKLFEQTKGQPLSEAHGAALAEWARGGVKAPAKPTATRKAAASVTERVDAFKLALKNAPTPLDVEAIWRKGGPLRQEVDPDTLDSMTLAYEGRLSEVQ